MGVILSSIFNLTVSIEALRSVSIPQNQLLQSISMQWHCLKGKQNIWYNSLSMVVIARRYAQALSMSSPSVVALCITPKVKQCMNVDLKEIIALHDVKVRKKCSLVAGGINSFEPRIKVPTSQAESWSNIGQT
jgi:hypothetical protein